MPVIQGNYDWDLNETFLIPIDYLRCWLKLHKGHTSFPFSLCDCPLGLRSLDCLYNDEEKANH